MELVFGMKKTEGKLTPQINLEMNQFISTSFKPFFSKRIPIENFCHVKIHFIQPKSNEKV